jgi:glycosyltransferase involved in cell wall biosynthesis
LRETLSKTGALVVPTEGYENSPLAVMEAFSMGIPALGSNLGGLPEILNEESGSVVFEARNPDNLARVFGLLWKQREKLPEMGTRARRAYENHFSPSVHMSKYLSIVRSPDS